MELPKDPKAKAALDALASGTLNSPAARAAAEYQNMRDAQRQKDILESVDTIDVVKWKEFCLRWGLAPPPKGFGDEDTMRSVMHKVRMCIVDYDIMKITQSAQWLIAQGVELPGSFVMKDGVLSGSPFGKK